MRYYSIITLSFFLFTSCHSNEGEFSLKDWAVEGDSLSKIQAYFFFEEIGGIDKWSELGAVHSKSTIFEPSFDSYQSEQWFSLEDTTLLLYTRKVNDYTITQMLNGDEGWVSELKNASAMTDNTKKFMNYWHSMNFFNCITKLARGKNLFIRFTADGYLYVLNEERENVLFGFKFESGSWLPTQFLRPMFNDQNISLIIDRWEMFDRLKVPMSMRTIDSVFIEALEEIELCKDMDCFDVQFTVDHMNSL